MPTAVALIPARAGSERVPQKNVRPLAGHPLIAYAIATAQQAGVFQRVLCSTDSEEIAEIARWYGAEVPFLRPAEFARDESPDIDVFRHLLCFMRNAGEPLPELLVHLRPTGPVRRVALIDQAIEKILADPEADSLRSVSANRARISPGSTTCGTRSRASRCRISRRTRA